MPRRLGGLMEGLPGLLDIPGWIRAVASQDQHPFLQFIRYGLAGVVAMATNVLVFALSDRFLFPIGEGEPIGLPGWREIGPWLQEMGNTPRVQNYLRCNAVAFFLANGVAYVLNFKWVFESGRHSRRVEILLFFGVSFVAFVAGTILASILVGSFGIDEYIAKGSDVVAAVVINYICRKFLIFQR